MLSGVEIMYGRAMKRRQRRRQLASKYFKRWQQVTRLHRAHRNRYRFEPTTIMDVVTASMSEPILTSNGQDQQARVHNRRVLDDTAGFADYDRNRPQTMVIRREVERSRVPVYRR
jgi:hypothetical protein